MPNTSVYLDGTHSGWLNVGDITDRLLKAGVGKADGFFLNASNYQWTPNLEQYGTWISSCVAYVTQVNPGDFGNCGNQYWSGGPANNWTRSRSGPGARSGATLRPIPTANTAGINSRYDLHARRRQPTNTFVIDTSRNGQGPWTPTGEQAILARSTDLVQPARPGSRPPIRRREPLHAWPTHTCGSRCPGESDGQCSRGLGTGNNVVDPVWGRVDPAAGDWFDEQALELARLANPALQFR